MTDVSAPIASAPTFDPTKPLVVDVYHLDRVLDFKALKASGIGGVFLKATEGTATQDPAYHGWLKLAQDAGLRVGAYHFAHLSGDPILEADYYIDWAQPFAALALALDWEPLRDGSYPRADRAAAFVRRVLDRTSRKRMWVYGGNVLKESLGADPATRAFWSPMLLWLAQYGHTFQSPVAWGRVPDLWQNNGDSWGPGPHTLPGISGLVDNSRIVAGTPDDLWAKWANAA